MTQFDFYGQLRYWFRQLDYIAGVGYPGNDEDYQKAKKAIYAEIDKLIVARAEELNNASTSK